MVTIPRYQSRVGAPLRGQDFAKAFGPGAGEALRDVARVAAAADTVIDSGRTLWDLKQVKGAEQRRALEDQQAALEADEQEIALRADQLERGGRDRPQDPEAISLVVRQAVERLSPAARTIFERRIAPREAAWQAQARASAAEQTQARREAASVQREALGVEEYLRHADIDEDLGRLALASAVAQRGERLAAAGLAPEVVRAGQQDLLAEAEAARVARTAAHDPERAEQLLGSIGKVLPEATRTALSQRIGAGRDRLEAEREMGRLAEAGLGLEALLLEAKALGGGEPGRAEAFRGAAIGAWGQAQRNREAREDAAWSVVADQLTPDSPVTGWTQLDPQAWEALADWQRQAVRDHFEAPWREPDPEVEAMLKTMAGAAPDQFRALNLGDMASRLTPPRYAHWRALQLTARNDGPDWRVRQARFEQDARIIDRAAAELGLSDDQAWAARVAGQQTIDRARLLAGGEVSEAALQAACKAGLELDIVGLIPGVKERRAREKALIDKELEKGEAAAGQAFNRILERRFPKPSGPQIDWDYILGEENGRVAEGGPASPPKTKGYIPVRASNPKDHSSVTIASGVDIGQKSLAEVDEWGLDPALLAKLKPYIGARGRGAALLAENERKGKPLVVTPEEARQIDEASHSRELKRLAEKFDKDSTVGPFAALPKRTQTMLLSVYLQHGTWVPAQKTPRFWGFVTTGDWASAHRELLNFGDLTPDRRKRDAALLQQDIDAGLLKAKPPAPAKKPPPAKPVTKPRSQPKAP